MTRQNDQERIRILEYALGRYRYDDGYSLKYVRPALGKKPISWTDEEFTKAQLSLARAAGAVPL